MKTKLCVLGATSALSLSPLAVSPVSAAPVVSEPLATGFAGPTQVHVADDGDVYVADEFVATITKVTPQGDTAVVVTEAKGSDLGGVSVSARGRITYSSSGTGAGDAPFSVLKTARPDGTSRVLADLQEFETEINPDAHNRYGFVDVSKRCAAKLGEHEAPYRGVVESHPYAVTRAPGGGWYVADAAGNDVLKVGRRGAISVVYVGKPQPVVATKQAVEDNELPACTLGKTYAAEPVPTDVEVSKSGALFISLLPGGPEDPSLGARGKVVRVAPGSHRGTVVAKGLAGATNVALAGKRLFVTELFGGGIARVDKRTGAVERYVDLPGAVAVENAGGTLYVGVLGPDDKTPGSLHTVSR